MGLRIVFIFGVTSLVAIASLLLGKSSLPMLLPLAGIVMTLLSYGLWQLREEISSQVWDQYAPAVIAFAGLGIGSLLRLLIFEKSQTSISWEDIVAICLSLMTSGGVILLKRRRVMDKCHRCQNPLEKDRQLCPRGGEHWVCNRCWLADRVRCKDCESLKTPWLQLEDENWWLSRLGSRIRGGHCYSCRRNAVEYDLRQCGRCTVATCIRCWDLENGRCSKCGWVMPDLPEPLERFHAQFTE